MASTYNERVINSFDIKDNLEGRFWENGKIHQKIRERLLKISQDFMDSTSISWDHLIDIVLTGSIANFNWSTYSDVDVHIIVDFSKMGMDSAFLMDYFNAKKELWNQSHEDLNAYGYPIEMYVEDKTDFGGSSGVYSLLNDEWVKMPKGLKGIANKDEIKRLARKYIVIINTLERKISETNDPEKLAELTELLHQVFVKLRNGRRAALATDEKEMSTGNLLWKTLKRLGYISKIWAISRSVYNKLNSLTESDSKKKIYEKLIDFDMHGDEFNDDSSINNDIMKVSDRLSKYKYFPTSKEELAKIIRQKIKKFGNECDLNDIDVSEITDMGELFQNSKFNGDISKWDVSNVTYMSAMFAQSSFNGDISNWDVSKVTHMSGMFFRSAFNGDISNWDVSNVEYMSLMFQKSKFTGDLSKWNTHNVKTMRNMFCESVFNGDISNWDVSNVKDMYYMFGCSKFNKDISNWDVSNVTDMTDMFLNCKMKKYPHWYI